MRTSSTRHPGVKGLSFSRNSSALAYVSTFQPSPSITNCQERLTSGSSSTTRTIAWDCVFAVIVSPFFGFVVSAENHCSQCGRPEGAENGPKSHPASTGTKFRERAKRGLNRSKNAFSGRKICKNEWGRNSCHPDSQARERFVPDCAENAEDPSLRLAHRRRRRVRP